MPTVVTGNSSSPGYGSYEIKATPAQSDVVGLTSALGLKANQSDLLSIHDGSSIAQITQLTIKNANVYNGSAWLACHNLEFMNHIVVAQSSTTPHSIQVTAKWPTIAQVQAGDLVTQ